MDLLGLPDRELLVNGHSLIRLFRFQTGDSIGTALLTVLLDPGIHIGRIEFLRPWNKTLKATKNNPLVIRLRMAGLQLTPLGELLFALDSGKVDWFLANAEPLLPDATGTDFGEPAEYNS
jgi:hypothetical protein